jgi:trk system potassium uptake protein TrkA
MDSESIPVIESPESNKITGMIWLRDIQEEYQKEIERREISANLASNISMKGESNDVVFMEGYSINEIDPPKFFIGKSIRQLEIRAKYGVDVLSIKNRTKTRELLNVLPSPDYIIKENDRIVIAGEIKKINLLKILT